MARRRRGSENLDGTAAQQEAYDAALGRQARMQDELLNRQAQMLERSDQLLDGHTAHLASTLSW